MRKDAAENKKRLIAAAKDVMREGGYDVPLEVIVERAHVTRGTLYRNFHNRAELYLAVLDNEISEIKATIDHSDSCGLFSVMRKLIEVSDLYFAFASAAQGTTDPTEACSPDSLLRDIIAAPLADAKARGIVRQSLSAEEVLLACRMVSYGWRLDGEESRTVAIDKRLLLIIRGMSIDPDIR